MSGFLKVLGLSLVLLSVPMYGEARDGPSSRPSAPSSTAPSMGVSRPSAPSSTTPSMGVSRPSAGSSEVSSPQPSLGVSRPSAPSSITTETTDRSTLGVSRPNMPTPSTAAIAPTAPMSDIDRNANRQNSRNTLSDFDSGRNVPSVTSTGPRDNSPNNTTANVGVSRPGINPAPLPTNAGNAETPKPSIAGVSRPNAPVVATAPSSAVDARVNQSMSRNALAQYEADRNRASKPATPVDTAAAMQTNPAFSQAGRSYNNMDNYYADRNRGRQDWGTPSPVIMQNMSPNYGVWDVMFLTMMMNNISRPGYSEWSSAHRDDPEIKAWRRDADRIAQDNVDMRRKLDEMDAKMKNAAPAANSSELPPGITPAAAIAPEAMMNNPFMQAATQADKPAEKKGSGMTWVIIIGVIVILGVVGFLVLARIGRRPSA